jgi:L,D-transpeptidase catalytic domain
MVQLTRVSAFVISTLLTLTCMAQGQGVAFTGDRFNAVPSHVIPGFDGQLKESLGEPSDRPSPEDVDFFRAQIDSEFPDKAVPNLSETEVVSILKGSVKIDPGGLVPRDLLASALSYFQTNKTKFANQNVISIVDFGKGSAFSRLFVIDLKTGKVSTYHTTHGVGSDPNDTGTAEIFGNVVDSGMSSVGFFRTAETYSGTYGYAIRIDGLSDSNSNVRARAVVFHGWASAVEKNVKQARSHGCFAFDFKVRDEIINKIKGGSLIFAHVSGSGTGSGPTSPKK